MKIIITIPKQGPISRNYIGSTITNSVGANLGHVCSVEYKEKNIYSNVSGRFKL